MLTVLTPEAQAALIEVIDERIQRWVETRRQDAEESPLLTVDEAAELLRTTKAAIYKRLKRGQLRFSRPEGSRILIRRADLDHLLDR
jgi:excisionase family DNA binding protein